MWTVAGVETEMLSTGLGCDDEGKLGVKKDDVGGFGSSVSP